MLLKRLEVLGEFKWLWLKSVKHVNLYAHCAQCLGGEYRPEVGAKKSRLIEDLPLEDRVYYLCGVVKNEYWLDNFHLAFRPKKGSRIEIAERGLRVVIEDAESLPISPKYLDPNDPNIADPKYSTCRNWMFAHYFAKRLATDPSQIRRAPKNTRRSTDRS